MTTMKEMRNFVASEDSECIIPESFYDRTNKRFIPGFEAVHRYIEGVNTQFRNILDSMRHPEMIRMALDVSKIDGEDVAVPVPSGYEYVCARYKHPDTPQTERNDLRKVIAAYKIADGYVQLQRALDKGDLARINRILNGQKGARA